MANIDKIAVLTGALHALSARDEYKKQAEEVANILTDTCKKIASEVVDVTK